MIHLGYPCDNLGLKATTNRTLRLANLTAERVRERVAKNLADLRRILQWNAAQGIHLFRVGQHLIPFASHPRFPYDWQTEHGPALAELGALAQETGQRLTMHPGQYVNPGSPDPQVVKRSLAELRYSAQVLDRFQAPDGVIVLHLGGVYGDRSAAQERFVQALRGEEDVLRYLALEHDERLWSAAQVLEVAERLGTPVIIDSLHHMLHPDGLTLAEALALAWPTWQERGRPKVHISSQDPDKRPGAHAHTIDVRDFHALLEALPGQVVDIMVEAKGKEKAVLALQDVVRRA